MKRKTTQLLLTLLMTMTCAQTWAQDGNMIINEDFTSVRTETSVDGEDYNGWTLASTKKQFSSNWLSITPWTIKNITNPGYAITPAFGYAGDVLLSFNYIKPTNNKTTLTVSIDSGSGYFENEEKSTTSKSFDIILNSEYTKNEYYAKSIKIFEVSSDTKLKFTTKENVSAAIDDVKVIKLGEITLNESYDPAEAIEANATEEPIDIQTRRTLRAGIWNTLCLPFHVTLTTLESAIGTGRGIELRTYSGYDAGAKTMNFATPAGNAVSAGTPFLIKFSGEDVVNPTFSSVTLSNESAKTIESNGVSFVGTYKPVDLTTDGTNLFITTANKLAKPKSTGNRISGLRAFITVPSNFAASQARLAVSGGETTAIDGITADSGNNQSADGRSSLSDDNRRTAIYNLHGQRLKTAAKGLYIIGGRLTAKP